MEHLVSEGLNLNSAPKASESIENISKKINIPGALRQHFFNIFHFTSEFLENLKEMFERLTNANITIVVTTLERVKKDYIIFDKLFKNMTF